MNRRHENRYRISLASMDRVGFLSADDPRAPATVDAREERLTDERGSVHRLRSSDGLKGTFHFVHLLLAPALAQAGQPVRPRAVFERAAAFVNEVGLLAEEVDLVCGEFIGNFPQSFSHIGRQRGLGNF